MRKELKYWAEKEREWRESGVTQEKYCKKGGISKNRFKYKLKCVRAANKKGSFLSVKTDRVEPNTADEKSYCRLIFSDGGEVDIKNRSGLTGLKTLISDMIQI